MAFIRYKKFGKQEYAYECESYRDPETKQPKHRQKYLGVVVDKEKGIFVKKSGERVKQEKQILDYGDSYFLDETTKELPVIDVLKKVFGDNFDTLMSLCFHRITGGDAMCHAENWYDGNYVNKLFPNANMSSPDISNFLAYLGDENVQRELFVEYLPLVQGNNGKANTVIDSTGLPNNINMPITDWGHHNGGTEYEARLILAIERNTEQPLYFRYVAGNITDVTTLSNTIAEMRNLGISTSSALVDAGYYSENNLELLFRAGISFLIRMPSNRTAYKNIIAENVDIESPKYAVKYDKRGLFVKQNEVEICGNKAFAYLVLDPERRGREISNVVSQADDNLDNLDFTNCGKMVLLSSFKLNTDDVVPLYYTRQIAEKMFGIAKDDLGILPLRVHSERNFNGFMLLVFISLILSCSVKSRLGKKLSTEKALSILRNLKCKIYDGNLCPNEVNKKQRLIFEDTGVVVPKIYGI